MPDMPEEFEVSTEFRPTSGDVGYDGRRVVGRCVGDLYRCVGDLYWFGPGIAVKILAPGKPKDIEVAHAYVQARQPGVDEDGLEDDGLDPAYAAGAERRIWGSHYAQFNLVPGDGVVAYSADAGHMNVFGIVARVDASECVVEIADRGKVSEAANRRIAALERARDLVKLKGRYASEIEVAIRGSVG